MQQSDGRRLLQQPPAGYIGRVTRKEDTPMPLHCITRTLARSLVAATVIGGASMVAPLVGAGTVRLALACTSYTNADTQPIVAPGGQAVGQVTLWKSNCDGEVHTETLDYSPRAHLTAQTFNVGNSFQSPVASTSGSVVNTAEIPGGCGSPWGPMVAAGSVNGTYGFAGC
jgi:hypothetical protein